MSGGEQQMVAIGRAMMSNPQILMLDEPSLGLSPLLCKELFQNLARVRELGIGILLVEQNAKQSLAIADRGYLLENAHIVHEDSAANLCATRRCKRPISGRAAVTTAAHDCAEAAKPERQSPRLRDPAARAATRRLRRCDRLACPSTDLVAAASSQSVDTTAPGGPAPRRLPRRVPTDRLARRFADIERAAADGAQPPAHDSAHAIAAPASVPAPTAATAPHEPPPVIEVYRAPRVEVYRRRPGGGSGRERRLEMLDSPTNAARRSRACTSAATGSRRPARSMTSTRPTARSGRASPTADGPRHAQRSRPRKPPFPAWAALPFPGRAHLLLKVADVWERRKTDYRRGGAGRRRRLVRQGHVRGRLRARGVPRRRRPCATTPIGEVLPSEHGKFSMACACRWAWSPCISPWNMPGILTSRGFAFPLAAGNTIVLKPSEDTPYAGGLFFAEVLEEAGVPAGVFNVVTCSRDSVAEVGDELIDNPLVKGISFTGSTPVGRLIAAKAGAHLKKACVELGGKDSLIVLDDADMERATSAASFGSFMHQGQICMSVEKVLVQESIYPEFLRQFVERAAKLKIGDTADKANVIGPLINDRQVARVKAQIEDAVAKGAKAGARRRRQRTASSNRRS